MADINQQILQIESEIRALKQDRRERVAKIVAVYDKLNPNEVIRKMTERICELEDERERLVGLSEEVERVRANERLRAEKEAREREILGLLDELGDAKGQLQSVMAGMPDQEKAVVARHGIYAHKEASGLYGRVEAIDQVAGHSEESAEIQYYHEN